MIKYKQYIRSLDLSLILIDHVCMGFPIYFAKRWSFFYYHHAPVFVDNYLYGEHFITRKFKPYGLYNIFNFMKLPYLILDFGENK